MEANNERLKELITYLTETKGYKQSAIADAISVDRTAFNHCVTGRRITKSAEYITRIIERYKNDLSTIDSSMPLTPVLTQKTHGT